MDFGASLSPNQVGGTLLELFLMYNCPKSTVIAEGAGARMSGLKCGRASWNRDKAAI